MSYLVDAITAPLRAPGYWIALAVVLIPCALVLLAQELWDSCTHGVCDLSTCSCDCHGIVDLSGALVAGRRIGGER